MRDKLLKLYTQQARRQGWTMVLDLLALFLYGVFASSTPEPSALRWAWFGFYLCHTVQQYWEWRDLHRTRDAIINREGMFASRTWDQL